LKRREVIDEQKDLSDATFLTEAMSLGRVLQWQAATDGQNEPATANVIQKFPHLGRVGLGKYAGALYLRIAGGGIFRQDRGIPKSASRFRFGQKLSPHFAAHYICYRIDREFVDCPYCHRVPPRPRLQANAHHSTGSCELPQ
jgi:hypothetical protein